MTTSAEKSAFDRAVRPFLELFFPEKAEDVLKFQPDPETQNRIEELAGKSTEGELTAEERSEYEGYVRANKFIAVLQKQARNLLGSRS